MSAPTSGPRSRSIAGVAWTTVGVTTQAVGQFTVLAVLARYLTAEEFGVVTAALVVIGLGRVTTEGVIGPALTQRQRLSDEDVAVGFVLSVAAGVLVTAILFALAPAIAALFDMPQLVSVGRALSLVLLVQTLSAVPLALLLRELRFKRVAVAELLSFAVGFAPLGVGLAVTGHGVWSLVGAYAGQATVHAVALVLLRPHRVALRVRWSVAGGLLSFGGAHTAARYLNYVALQADFVIVGSLMSAAALGVYGRAYQLATTPATLLGNAVDKVLFPVLASHQDDAPRMAANLRRAVALTVALTAPLGAVMVVLGPEAVRVVLGPGWSEVVLPFQVLAAALALRTAYKLGDAVAKATGAVASRAWRQGVYALLVVVGCWAAHAHGLAAVAAAVAGAIVVNYLLMSALALDRTGLAWSAFLAAHGRGVMLAAVAGLAAWLAASAARGQDLPALVVLLIGLAAAAAAVLGPAAVWPARVLGADLHWLLMQLRGRRARRA